MILELFSLFFSMHKFNCIFGRALYPYIYFLFYMLKELFCFNPHLEMDDVHNYVDFNAFTTRN